MSVQAPFGTWKSPITSQLATEKCVAFEEVQVDKTSGLVYWAEARPSEAGRHVVCSLKNNGIDFASWTPKQFSARTRVHEYGGGACMVHGGKVFFSDFATQRLFVQNSSESTPEALSPENERWRYSDGFFSEKHGKMYYIREDHGVIESEGKREAQNSVVVIDPVTKDQKVLAIGADFYSSPRVSPDGTKLAWVQWFHPNMPWDSTELWVANLNNTGDCVVENSANKVVGGVDISVMLPRWTVDNRLLYIGDQTEWWNLYIVSTSGEHINLRKVDMEIGGPHWSFGWNAYDVDHSGSGLVATSYGGKLGVLNLNTQSYKELNTGFDSHVLVQFGNDGNIYCRAAGPTQFSAIIKVNVQTEQVSVIKVSRETPLDGYISVPESISWKTSKDDIAHGYLYLPKNKDFEAPPGELPPLLVKVHGGPTGDTKNDLDLLIQYFTSRGFAILDVNYRGSTGFGKTYRHKLRKNWGVYDVEDCCSGALHLAETKRVDSERLCIDGGSAGGYTTLACLAFKDVFKAGASLYGVADIEILMQETHKFESRYIDNLVCEYKDENMPLIHSRSPIKHIEKFNCAIVFFQGDEDEIVPPNQAKIMFDAVRERKIPCSHVLFEGEQHGFRKAENIQKCLDGEFYFFSKVFGFEPADKVGELPIYNLQKD